MKEYNTTQNGNLVVWFLGYLSAQLDLLALFDSDIESDVSPRLVKAVDDNKHADHILNILYNQLHLCQNDLATELGVEISDISESLIELERHHLVFTKNHRSEIYYSLSGNGQKVLKHLKVRDCSLTPNGLAVHIDRLLKNILAVSHGLMTSNEAINIFRSFAWRHTTNSQQLEQVFLKTINSVISNKESGRLASSSMITSVSAPKHRPLKDAPTTANSISSVKYGPPFDFIKKKEKFFPDALPEGHTNSIFTKKHLPHEKMRRLTDKETRINNQIA
jgi:DNA-binding MarR family transcriptional regulator